MTAAKKTGHPDTCLQVPQVLARWECNEEASPVFSEYLGCPSSEWWMAGEELSTAEREDPRRVSCCGCVTKVLCGAALGVLAAVTRACSVLGEAASASLASGSKESTAEPFLWVI